MHVGAAVSTTRESGLAAAEAADEAAQPLDGGVVDLAVVFATPDHVPEIEDVLTATRTRLDPGVVIGGVAQGIVGPHEEHEQGPAVSVWCASFGGGQAIGFRSRAIRREEGGMVVSGWPDTHPDDVTLVLADPLSYPAPDVVRRMGEDRPGHVLVGGLVTGGQQASRLLLNRTVHTDGAVGAVLRDVDVDVLVSQGCRPVGEPLTVTRAERNVILELAGTRAADRLRQIFHDADPRDQDLLRAGLHIGIVADEYREDFETGDFLIRSVLGADPETGGIAVGDLVPVGTTVQFQVRDAASADADLTTRLTGQRPAEGALLFTCNGRGLNLFGEPHHDVRAVESSLDAAVSGAFCAGEIGPVAGRPFLHGFTASMALFRDERT